MLVREQQVEYERVQAAYSHMNAALDHAAHERRHSEAMILDLQAELRRDSKRAL